MTTAGDSEERVYTGPLPAVTNLNRPHWDGLREHRLLAPLRPLRDHLAAARALVPGVLVAGGLVGGAERPGDRDVVGPLHQQYYRSGPFEVPYEVAEVTLEEGPRLYAQLLDAEPVVGMAVEIAYDDVSADLTLARFRPTDAAPASD